LQSRAHSSTQAFRAAFGLGVRAVVAAFDVVIGAGNLPGPGRRGQLLR
jgi:hypothetical protein